MLGLGSKRDAKDVCMPVSLIRCGTALELWLEAGPTLTILHRDHCRQSSICQTYLHCSDLLLDCQKIEA